MATIPSTITVQATGKKGYKTTEFWVTILTQAATIGGAFGGMLPPKYAAIVVGISQAAYAISRGLAKSGEVPAQ